MQGYDWLGFAEGRSNDGEDEWITGAVESRVVICKASSDSKY